MKRHKAASQSAVSEGANQVQGEGDYDAARRFDADQAAFAKDPEKVKRKAREAADALDSEEGRELRAAEEKARRKGSS